MVLILKVVFSAPFFYFRRQNVEIHCKIIDFHQNIFRLQITQLQANATKAADEIAKLIEAAQLNSEDFDKAVTNAMALLDGNSIDSDKILEAYEIINTMLQDFVEKKTFRAKMEKNASKFTIFHEYMSKN